MVKDGSSEIRVRHDTIPDLSAKLFTSFATFQIIATYDLQLQIISALAWICAAFRQGDRVEISHSSVSLEGKKPLGGESHTGDISLVLDPLENIAAGDACWHALFPHCVIAKQFPVPSRKKGKGLEISFADMALASRCLSFVELENGLIAHGLASVLIPVEELPEDDALQWHLESKRQSSSRRSVWVSQTLQNIDTWHKESLLHRLVERRCFLGWVGKADVVVGTKTYSSCQITESSTKTSPAVRNVTSHSITFGTSGMGSVTATGTFGRTPAAMPTHLRSSDDKDLYDLLMDGKDESVLVYDDGEKVGWCLPQASVVLLLAHLIISQRRYRVYDGPNESSLGYAEPGPDGFTQASTAILDSFKLKYRKYHSETDFVEEPMSGLLKKIWVKLTDIGNGLAFTAAEFQKVKKVPPNYIHGVEFCDIVKMKTSLRIKEAKIEQLWGILTNRYPIVIFCKGLGQAIVPSVEESICDSWATVPANENIMVAPGPVVRDFLDQDEGLGRGVEWCAGKTLIQSHEPGLDVPIIHTQGLRVTSSPVCHSHIKEQIGASLTGALLFVHYTKTRKCLEESRREAQRASVLPRDLISSRTKPLPDLPSPRPQDPTEAEIGSDIHQQNDSPTPKDILYHSAGRTLFESPNRTRNSTFYASNSSYAPIASIQEPGNQPVGRFDGRRCIEKKQCSSQLHSCYQVSETKNPIFEDIPLGRISIVTATLEAASDEESQGTSAKMKGKETAV
jgi:hypothetical protein